MKFSIKKIINFKKFKSLHVFNVKFFSEKGENIKFVKVDDIKNFGRKFSEDEMKKYLDPFGFLAPNESKFFNLFKEKDHLDNKNTQKVSTPESSSSNDSDFLKKLEKLEKIEDPKIKAYEKSKIMPKEYGYKYHGLEPTRYGDWEIKGKCSDF